MHSISTIILIFSLCIGIADCSKADDPGPLFIICDESPNELCSCTKHTVSCSNARVEQEELGLFKKLDTLNVILPKSEFIPTRALFDHNAIVHINRFMLSGMENITELNLSHNKISRIDDDSFLRFPNISKLYLQNNQLDNVRRGWFDSISDSLQLLDLSSNKIKNMDPDAFINFVNLKKLIFDSNPISAQSQIALSFLESLEVLSLDDCDIKELDSKTFKSLKNLTKLSLRNNLLKKVPQGIVKELDLNALDLSGTLIDEIPTNAFAGASEITTLYLEDMPNLKVIHECAFCGMDSLKHISFSKSSQIEQLHPNAFGFKDNFHLSKIETLDISWTNITLEKSLLDYGKLRNFIATDVLFDCGCDKKFLRKIPSLRDIRCDSPKSLSGRLITELDSDEMCLEVVRSRRFFFGLFGAIISVFVLTIVFILCRLRRQRKKNPAHSKAESVRQAYALLTTTKL